MDVVEAKNFYLARYADFERALASAVVPDAWGGAIRGGAISRFAAAGFPGVRDEEWKYTSIAPILNVPFGPARPLGDGLARERLAQLDLGAPVENRLVFINGRLSAELSAARRLPAGVEAGSLAAAMRRSDARVAGHLARYAKYDSQSFVALNTAFMEDGGFVFVPAGVAIEEPIHLVFVALSADGAGVCYPRNLIVLERGAEASVVETYLSLERSLHFTNGVTEAVVGENCRLEHVKIQRESEEAFHIGTLQVQMGRSSRFTSHSLALGGALARNDINVALVGEGGDCTLNGLYIAGGRQHIDNHTRIDHVEPRCASRELYKGILGGRARGVFSGKIYVHKAAEKSDAKQTNKNLLLSESAWVDTKPQLEIHNNDVKCSHGSTIGQVDQDALFYLRSRGIGRSAACALLTQGFAGDVVARLPAAAGRAALEDRVRKRLEAISGDDLAS
jgi:Fe-S cluster assembly protein SufD